MGRRRISSTLLAAAALVAGLLAVTPAAGSAGAAPSDATDPTANEAPGFAKLRGISLTEASTRLGWQDRAPDFAEALAGHLPARFGGAWIAVTSGDRVKVGITGQLDAGVLATIARDATTAGLTGAYDVVPVVRTLAALDADAAWLGTELERVNAGALVALTSGERIDINQLRLEIPAQGTLTAAQSSLVATAPARLGAELVVTRTGHAFNALSTYPWSYGYWGGSRILYPPDGKSCTEGFSAQSTSYPDDWHAYILMAGHCAYQHYGTWHSKVPIGADFSLGPVWHWEWNATWGDVAMMQLPGGYAVPYVLVTASPYTTDDPAYMIKAVKKNLIGMRICTTGAWYGSSTCGTVTQLGVTATYGGVTVHSFGRSDVCSVPGDSGAPMYATHNAYGLLDAGPPGGGCDTLYQGAIAAQNAMGVVILTHHL